MRATFDTFIRVRCGEHTFTLSFVTATKRNFWSR